MCVLNPVVIYHVYIMNTYKRRQVHISRALLHVYIGKALSKHFV